MYLLTFINKKSLQLEQVTARNYSEQTAIVACNYPVKTLLTAQYIPEPGEDVPTPKATVYAIYCAGRVTMNSERTEVVRAYKTKGRLTEILTTDKQRHDQILAVLNNDPRVHVCGTIQSATY